MQLGFYVDQSRCSNCLACVVACKDWHNIPEGPIFWIRVQTVEEGEFPDLDVSFLPVPCYHCEDPACLKKCPVDAVSKRDSDGIVMVESDVCIGKEQCGSCLEACPYGAPQFGIEPNAKVQKCNLCLDRWEENKKPICVEACPMRALDAGPLDELEAKYGRGREAKGFPGHHECRPSVTFKSKD